MSISATVAMQRAGIEIDDFDGSGVTIKLMPRWMEAALGHSVDAVTIGNNIYVTEDRHGLVLDGRDRQLLLHELVHVYQWRREGRVPFLFRYVCQYLRNRMIGLEHTVAYRAISYEAAAFEASERPRTEQPLGAEALSHDRREVV